MTSTELAAAPRSFRHPMTTASVGRAARALLLAAAAAALLAAAAPAAAQDPAATRPSPGSLCGPNGDGVWIKTDRLAASGGGSVGADGCITADAKSTTAFVQANLGNATYTLFEIYTAPSGSGAKRNGTVYIGDVDLTLWPKQTPKVLRSQAACGPAPLAGGRRVPCNASWSGADPVGRFVSVVAKGVKVCGLMVCVKEKLFSDRGEALSAKAAALYDEYLTNQGISPVPDLGAAALPETCAGYTTQGWSRCPKGKKCVSTYKPGDDHCACFKCTVWTPMFDCEQGDTWIGNYGCCFTCPMQRVCAVCQVPCVDEVSAVEVIPGQMPTTPNSYTPGAGKLSASSLATNYGGTPQQVTASFAFSQQLQSSMKYATKFTFSEKATVKIGLPFFDEKGQLEFTASQEISEEKTTSATRTVTVTYTLAQQIPAFTAQAVNATAEVGMLEVAIPVTVKTTYTCSGVKQAANTALVQTQGVMTSATSKLTITYGRQIPLDPPIVFDPATATCVSNPLCRQMGLTTGNCCPNALGSYNPCCSFCAPKPACADFAVDNTTMCCPTRANQYNACCSK